MFALSRWYSLKYDPMWPVSHLAMTCKEKKNFAERGGCLSKVVLKLKVTNLNINCSF